MAVESDIFSEKNIKYLLVFSRWAISNSLFPGLPAPTDPLDLPQGNFGVFITLKRNGETRGKAGSIKSTQALQKTIIKYAIQAANSSGQPKVELTELPAIIIELSIITSTESICTTTPVHLLTAIKPNVHGLQLEDKSSCAKLMPDMWQKYPERQHFIDAIMAKGGWNTSLWPMGLQGTKFQTISCRENYQKPARN